MERINIDEFKNQSNIEIIKSIMNVNNGYITSKQITELGIHRMFLNIMVKRNIIKRLENGIYIDSNMNGDPYYVLSLNLGGIIYSHMSALYLHGLLKDEPLKYNVTVKKTYNDTKLKQYNVYRVAEDIYNLGLTEIKTKDGNMVRVYDVERCICDIVKYKKKLDSKQVNSCIREYFNRNDNNINRLMEYAKKIGVLEKITELVELFLG